MAELPTGTVTLLFSDIEGSTVLLSRLGPAYGDALDGQRQVLRAAWTEHGGREMGTEGDSFFVVFPTAEGAVRAAGQAQRELSQYPWPGGERVRVRMGIHTGTPQVHDDGYVGMDVHRAARIAGAAHGGQVVVSSSTTELVRGALPDGAALVDLGSHRLKDIPQTEHLFQLAHAGLPADFPPLKSLGAVSSLPRPATPLVGRNAELAELAALLSLPDVRLVTLTGPGGSGKTRLAIGVAHRLVPMTPDGVYFVPLAAVTSPDSMWTSIAETLDVPSGARMPPELFAHVAHRSALLVLDNLEQMPGADQVVAELLDAAPSVMVVTTSRRPLHVPGEYEHAVPPLELPKDTDTVEASGAVQMFVQQARMVRPGFGVTADNAADVTAVCRRLDGLPLAIELAAARSKLLSPHALLHRLDAALDLAAGGSHVPSRHKTLRNTIAWSYQLLDPAMRGFFRSLGVFAGGADLDAVAAVATQRTDGADALDLVAELADASLITIAEDAEGEPRVGMLETIRAFALDELRQSGDEMDIRREHARHYLALAERLYSQLHAGGTAERVLQARGRFGSELNNYREALTWALPPDRPGATSPEQAHLGLKICASVCQSWFEDGYITEAQQWLRRAIDRDSGGDSLELGRSLWALAAFTSLTGDYTTGRTVALRSADILRRIGERRELAMALIMQGQAERALGDYPVARQCLHEAIALSRRVHDRADEAQGLAELAFLEHLEGNLERRLQLELTVLAIHEEVGNDIAALAGRHNLACTLRLLGRLEEAHEAMRELIPQMVKVGQSDGRTSLTEDYAALLADLGHHEAAARLIGAADARREQSGTCRNSGQEAEVAKPFAEIRKVLPMETWDREYQHGHAMTVEDALTEAQKAALGL